MVDALWFIPGHGDGPYLGTDTGKRAPTHEYLAAVARAIDSLGYYGALIPTGFGCQDGHAVRVGGEALHHLEHFGGKRRILRDLRAERFQFGLTRQAAVPQQINNFFKQGVGGEVFDAVADIRQLALFAVDQTGVAVGDADVAKALR